MNNKGFATSFILFSLLILFLVVMGILVFTLNNSSKLNNKVKNELVNKIEDTFESDSRKIDAKDIEFDSSMTESGSTSNGVDRIGLNDCTNLQCAIDKISNMVGN